MGKLCYFIILWQLRENDIHFLWKKYMYHNNSDTISSTWCIPFARITLLSSSIVRLLNIFGDLWPFLLTESFKILQILPFAVVYFPLILRCAWDHCLAVRSICQPSLFPGGRYQVFAQNAFQQLMITLTKTRAAGPVAAKQPHNIKGPPQYFTVGTVKWSSMGALVRVAEKLSFGLIWSQ